MSLETEMDKKKKDKLIFLKSYKLTGDQKKFPL